MSAPRDRLQALAGCADAAGLRSAIARMCAEFGTVTNMDILTIAEADKRRALCFLRLESSAQELRLMTACGVPRFGEDLLVIVDLACAAPPADRDPGAAQPVRLLTTA
ncbi:MAG TPA: hypothetical protein VF876_03380 [Burkholderiales bacterium]